MSDTERIDELERRVKELEAQPRQNHFHYYPPVFQPSYVPSSQTMPSGYVYTGDPLPGTPGYMLTIGGGR